MSRSGEQTGAPGWSPNAAASGLVSRREAGLRLVGSLAGLAGARSAWAQAGSKPRGLDGARRVLYLGDSITYAGQYVEWVETGWRLHPGSRAVEMLNVGLPSETVSGLSEPGHAGGQFPRPDLHERLDRVLAKIRPDLAIVCYGMNDGIYLPFAEERFRPFREGLERLRQKCAAAGIRVIHVTPPVFEEKRAKSPGYADTLDRYAAWMVSQRQAGWEVIDIHAVLRAHLEERWKTDPGYFLSGDGVHPGETGHWLMARTILAHLGVSEVAADAEAAAMVRRHPQGAAVLAKVQARQRLLRDAWLTETGHQRPGMGRGVPMTEATAKAEAWEREIEALLKRA